MNLEDCYRLLNLKYGASRVEVKASYRRLARRYHPDVNVGDKFAQEKFIELTDAYKYLLNFVISSESNQVATQFKTHDAVVSPSPPSKIKVTRKPIKVEFIPLLSETEKQLKWTSYEQLQQLLKAQKFARAITLAEALAQRIPQDPEVRQWQAIAYASWGRHLVKERQLDKARIYLKKALRTDPHNRSLWAEIEKDFRHIERML